MLVAELAGERVYAQEAVRSQQYTCPGCLTGVILHKGRIRIHHFAHRPEASCNYGTCETAGHLEAKSILHQAFTLKGLYTEVECHVPNLPGGDRRADVMVWTEKKNRIAIEVQHSSIGLDEIERRSFSYAEAGIAQIWIPFLPKDWVERKSYSETEERFNLNLKQKPFEIWIHGLNKGYGAWYYDAEDKKFYFGMRLDGLTIVGPYDATELELFVTKRHKFVTPTYTWPAAYVAHFRPLFGLRFWHKTIGDIRNQIREERTRMQLSILQARRERVSAVKSMAQRREEAFEHRPKFISAYFQDKERPEDKDVGLYWFDR